MEENQEHKFAIRQRGKNILLLGFSLSLSLSLCLSPLSFHKSLYLVGMIQNDFFPSPYT